MDKVDYKTKICPHCQSKKIVNGVADRINELSDHQSNSDIQRPEYIYQVPLEYLPGLGPKTFEKLLDTFGTEMNVIHNSTLEALKACIPLKLAELIISMRNGEQQVQAGGGGKYGQIKR